MVIEESQREEQLSQELREIHFAHAVSAQAQQELLHWEHQERAAYETRFAIARHQLAQDMAQQKCQREIESLQHFHRLKAEVTEAETSYRTSVRQEAEAFAQQLREEVAFHANTAAQAQSLLSAEHQQYDKNMNEQTERWQSSLDIVVEGATEELQEYKAETEELTAELLEAQQELWEWEDFYQEQTSAPDPFAETTELFASFNEQDASTSKSLPPPAPLTPAVLQAPQLQAQHLPPQALPFTNRIGMLNFERHWRRSGFLREVSRPELRERRQLSQLLGHIPQVRQQD